MYIWIKAFHVISFVSWFAVLFYLPRLFVYHAENKDKADFVEVVKIMQKKLFRIIGIPAFVCTISSGVGMIILQPLLLKAGWLHAKISVVILLSVYFFHAGHMKNQLAEDKCEKSGKFFRIYNEIPTIFLILIVTLAVVKHF